MVYELVYIWNILGIWFLTFNLVYKLVYDGYVLNLQRMTRKMMVTDNVWSDFTHSGICAVYKNRTVILTGKWLFLLYHCYVQYQRLQKMTIFDWYTSFIWQSGICIATFFIWCATIIFLNQIAIVTSTVAISPPTIVLCIIQNFLMTKWVWVSNLLPWVPKMLSSCWWLWMN